MEISSPSHKANLFSQKTKITPEFFSTSSSGKERFRELSTVPGTECILLWYTFIEIALLLLNVGCHTSGIFFVKIIYYICEVSLLASIVAK